jgi:hypothetical protein
MKTSHKKYSLPLNILAITSIVFLAFTLAFTGYKYYSSIKVFENNPANSGTVTDPNINPPVQSAKSLPESRNLDVAYAAQAPFGNWAVHEESCEEAAIYMYKGYLDGVSYPGNRIPDAEADVVYKDMKAWEIRAYGSEPDLTMTALGAFAHGYYGYSAHVEKNITADTIKTAVSTGHPVVVPVMTHSLQNKMYGPISVYHVLLIKGYDATGVFTNDAGVGNGPNMHYTWDILFAAIDAQTAKMNQGRDLLYLTK